MHPAPRSRARFLSATSLAVILIQAMPLGSAAPAQAGGWARTADARATWVCNAYGRGGSQRSAWQTVSGTRSGSEAAAKASAMSECRRRYSGCQPSGCWPG